MKIQKYWTSDEDEYLTNNYGILKTRKIAENLGRSYQSIKSRATKVLKIPHGGLCQNMLLPLLEDTNFNWYWLGFIAGDGNVCGNYLRIIVHPQDKTHLELFAKYLNVLCNIDKNGYVIFDCSDSCGIEDVRRKLGYQDGVKTYYPLDINYNISSENMWSFIFGFIDADGCIEVKNTLAKQVKIEIHSSWLKNLQNISKFIKTELGIESKVTITGRGYALLRITKHSNIVKLREKLLSLNIPFLARKWDKFDNVVKGTSFYRDIEDEVLQMYKNGDNLHAISKKLGVGYGSLYNHKKEIILKSEYYK